MALVTTSSVAAPADDIPRPPRPRSMVMFDAPSPDAPSPASSSSFLDLAPQTARLEFSRRHTTYLSAPSRARPRRSSPLAGPSLALSHDGTLTGSDESGSLLSYSASVSASAASTWSASSCEHGTRFRAAPNVLFTLPSSEPAYPASSSSEHSADVAPSTEPSEQPPEPRKSTSIKRRLSVGFTKLRSTPILGYATAPPPVPPVPPSATAMPRNPTVKNPPTSTRPRSILLPPAHSMADAIPPEPSPPARLRAASPRHPRPTSMYGQPGSTSAPTMPTSPAHPHRRSYLSPSAHSNSATDPEHNWLTMSAAPRFSRAGLKAEGVILPVAANSKEGMRARQRALSSASTTRPGTRPVSVIMEDRKGKGVPGRPASMIVGAGVPTPMQALHTTNRSRSMNQLLAQYQNGEVGSSNAKTKGQGGVRKEEAARERPATAPARAPIRTPSRTSLNSLGSLPCPTPSQPDPVSSRSPSLRSAHPRPLHARTHSAASTLSPASSTESLHMALDSADLGTLRPPLAPFVQDDTGSLCSLASADTPSLAFTSGGSRTGSEASLSLGVVAEEGAEVRVVDEAEGERGDIGLQRLDIGVRIGEHGEKVRPAVIRPPVYVGDETKMKDADTKSTHSRRSRKTLLVRVRVHSGKEAKGGDETTALAPQRKLVKGVASSGKQQQQQHDGGIRRMWRRVVQSVRS